MNIYSVFCQTRMSQQVFHDTYYLYIFAPDNDCRQRWVRALKEGKRPANDPEPQNISVTKSFFKTLCLLFVHFLSQMQRPSTMI